jgi:hypothetical protein
MLIIMLDANEQHQVLLETDGNLTIQPRQEDKDETRLTPDEAYHLYVLLHEHYQSQQKNI